MISRARFSLASLLLLTTVCTVSLAVWRAFFYESPTDRILLYEKAPGTWSDSISVGPNSVRIKVVARSDRDGSLRRENGRGVPVASPAANESELTQAAAWLDVVQIELEPDLVDIIEARVFNHESREIIAEAQAPFGWRVTAPHIVQIYGLGRALPATLDVWFRAHSYRAGDPVANLATAPAASCQLSDGTLTLEDVRSGSWSYQGGALAARSDEHDDSQLSAVLSWAGPRPEVDYQIAAVSKRGERVHTETFHFLTFAATGESSQFVSFDLPLAELDHFELRPFGGRHAFFFEGLALPAVSSQPFVSSPTASVSVNGQEVDANLPDFAPLKFHIIAKAGDWAIGVAAGRKVSILQRGDAHKDASKAFTLTYHVEGLAGPPPRLSFVDAASGKLLSESLLAPSLQRGEGATVQAAAGYRTYAVPLDRVRSIQVNLGR